MYFSFEHKNAAITVWIIRTAWFDYSADYYHTVFVVP